jgi:hypothetical protein
MEPAHVNDRTLTRVAGVTALLAAAAQIGDFVVIFTVGGDELSQVFTDPLSLLRAGPGARIAMHWSPLLSMLGYQLLLLPLVVFLRTSLQAESRNTGMIDLYAACGFAYIVIAAIGSALMAIVHPYLMTANVGASPTQREAIEITLLAFHNGIAYGCGTCCKRFRSAFGYLGRVCCFGLVNRCWEYLRPSLERSRFSFGSRRRSTCAACRS